MLVFHYKGLLNPLPTPKLEEGYSVVIIPLYSCNIISVVARHNDVHHTAKQAL
jgi:hypothetical protein